LYHLEKNKHLEISLQQHSRLSALGEMLENIAHQWRQPLSCITTLMSGIKIKQEMNILTPEDILDANDGILKNAYFLSDTIENFKQFTKTQGEIKEFNVSKTIKNTLKIVDSTFKTMMINVELNLDENIVYNGIDKELSQALLNILINAKDALLLNNINTRLIKITLEEKEMFYEISIFDNALGIKESIKNKIFDPYFTTKHQYSGTGLGLYISSQIIKIQFNGEIQTYNFQDNENKGACFIIKLPKKELNAF
jgi:C4-dicarboxylate-specific signal transduction histidine kinase